jgi:hypothetical protein
VRPAPPPGAVAPPQAPSAEQTPPWATAAPAYQQPPAASWAPPPPPQFAPPAPSPWPPPASDGPPPWPPLAGSAPAYQPWNPAQQWGPTAAPQRRRTWAPRIGIALVVLFVGVGVVSYISDQRSLETPTTLRGATRSDTAESKDAVKEMLEEVRSSGTSSGALYLDDDGAPRYLLIALRDQLDVGTEFRDIRSEGVDFTGPSRFGQFSCGQEPSGGMAGCMWSGSTVSGWVIVIDGTMREALAAAEEARAAVG